MTPSKKSIAQVPLAVRISKIIRARDMIKAGYPIHTVEKRVKSGIDSLARWAAELNIKFDRP